MVNAVHTNFGIDKKVPVFGQTAIMMSNMAEPMSWIIWRISLWIT
jgi:hypothetical protein